MTLRSEQNRARLGCRLIRPLILGRRCCSTCPSGAEIAFLVRAQQYVLAMQSSNASRTSPTRFRRTPGQRPLQRPPLHHRKELAAAQDDRLSDPNRLSYLLYRQPGRTAVSAPTVDGGGVLAVGTYGTGKTPNAVYLIGARTGHILRT